MIHQPLHVFTQVKIERYQIWHLGWPGTWTSATSADTCHSTDSSIVGKQTPVSILMEFIPLCHDLILLNILLLTVIFSNIETSVFLNHCQCISIIVGKWNAYITHDRHAHTWNYYFCTLCWWTVYSLSLTARPHEQPDIEQISFFPWWLNINHLPSGVHVYILHSSPLPEGVVGRSWGALLEQPVTE